MGALGGLLIALALWPGGVEARSAASFDQVGQLYARTFGPEDYDAGPFNLDVVQGPNDLVYVANEDGVLEYDGVSWRLIPISNRSSARSLAFVSGERLFVGAKRDLGYLAPDSAGRVRYVSLVDRIPPIACPPSASGPLRVFRTVRDTTSASGRRRSC